MVKMLVSTYYEGITYKQGETYPLSDKTEQRWIKNKIAEVVESAVMENDSEKTAKPRGRKKAEVL